MSTCKSSPSKLPDSRASYIEREFHLVKELIDPIYGEVKLLTDVNNSNDIFCKTYIIDSTSELEHTVHLLKKRLELKHPYLFGLLDYSYQKHSAWCSTSYTIKAYYHYNDHSFSKELEIRKACNKSFQDEELATLLFEQSEVLTYLQQSNFAHGDIRPGAIFLKKDPDAVSTALCERLSTTEIKNCQAEHIHLNRKLYMSPILFKNLLSRKSNFIFNQWKSDAFSFGLVLLEAATLSSIQGIYDKRQGIMHLDALNGLLELMQGKYPNSTWITGVVRKL